MKLTREGGAMSDIAIDDTDDEVPDEERDEPDEPRYGNVRFIIAVVLLVGIVAMAVVMLAGLGATSNSTPNNRSSSNSKLAPSTDDNSSPDPVKSQDGSNGDNTPSSTGTGSNGNNSLLSQ
jgi:hypothetical protein